MTNLLMDRERSNVALQTRRVPKRGRAWAGPRQFLYLSPEPLVTIGVVVPTRAPISARPSAYGWVWAAPLSRPAPFLGPLHSQGGTGQRSMVCRSFGIPCVGRQGPNETIRPMGTAVMTVGGELADSRCNRLRDASKPMLPSDDCDPCGGTPMPKVGLTLWGTSAIVTRSKRRRSRAASRTDCDVGPIGIPRAKTVRIGSPSLGRGVPRECASTTDQLLGAKGPWEERRSFNLKHPLAAWKQVQGDSRPTHGSTFATRLERGKPTWLNHPGVTR